MSDVVDNVFNVAPANTRDLVIQHLWNTGSKESKRLPYLHCLLDAAQDKRIYPRLIEFAESTEIASLYQGTVANELASVAPYLISLESDTRIFDWVWEEGWGQSWGIFFWSVLTFEGLRNHFRRSTKIKIESGEMLIFRFYDPRVLPTALAALNPLQVQEFFGPVSRFSAEASNGQGIEHFTHVNGMLKRVSHAIPWATKDRSC